MLTMSVISMWGSYGSGNGQFDKPLGIAVDSKGNVFVADAGNNRIQKFQLVHSCPSGTTQVGFGVCFNTEWGSYGSGKGQFSFPEGIAADSKGNVFVVDAGSSRIQKFLFANPCPSGTTQVVYGVCFIITWGSFFSFPHGIAVDSSGNVSVSDTFNDRIQTFL